MKKIICICNTYYQLIMLVQMKRELWEGCQVDVLISDHSANAAAVSKRLNSKAWFHSVSFVQTKHLDQKQSGKWKQIKSVLRAALSVGEPWRRPFEKEAYDSFFFFNISVSTLLLYYALCKVNPKLVCCCYEEGVFNYAAPQLHLLENRLSGRVRLIEKLRAIQGQSRLLPNVSAFYCMYPQLYQGPLVTKCIPHISAGEREVWDLLTDAFGLKEKEISYPQKYIYFSSICDFEGGEPIGELELIKEIAALVGRENLMLKVHPRDDVNRFLREGLCVDENSNVPWEIIQMNYDFSNHVFLTATSTGAISGLLELQQPIRTYFLYPLCKTEKNSIAQQSIASLRIVMDKLQENTALKNIHVITKLKEILFVCRGIEEYVKKK